MNTKKQKQKQRIIKREFNPKGAPESNAWYLYLTNGKVVLESYYTGQLTLF